ncbi:hypothetical protein [Leisingera caerulea]|uniref:hypothetical protein n=1 Tax=Leisingera caerulea TaxID=506591 RepID=UPI0004206765|nr:hypothetical protein [Leisingera caerulea]
MAVSLPGLGAAEGFGGLFAFQEPASQAESAPPAASQQPVQARLQQVPSLDGPYGHAMPSLEELKRLGPDAALPAQAMAAQRRIQPEASQPAGTAAPMRAKMNPLDAPVRANPGKRRYTRRLAAPPAARPAKREAAASETGYQRGAPAPLIPGYEISPSRTGQ